MLTNSLNVTPSNTLLATKLYRPQRHVSLVSRPHLVSRLNAGLASSLTLVCAPAGFGKTTLLAEWLAGQERRVAWLSLEEADDDPVRFLDYLIAALQPVQAKLDTIRSLLKAPQLPPLEAVVTLLLHELTSDSSPLSLVLDDYHLVKNQAVHHMVSFLLEHLPPSMNLVIASRTDPPLPLARLRVKGKLSEMRADDLRFKSEEVAHFLNDARGLELRREDIALLETHTEGWIASLHLAALSMQGRSDLPAFVAAFTGSHRFVLDYLSEEVLHQQPQDIQDFLLQTSLLERLNASLCDAVTGRDDGQKTLEYLERANLFLVALDDERRWYRYHHLFAEVLQNRLRHARLDQIPELHRRASHWLAQNGFIYDAVKHLLSAKDSTLAATMMAAAAPALAVRGEVATLRTWLELLPADVTQQHLTLSLHQIWIATLDNAPDRADVWVRHCERLLTNLESSLEPQRSELEGTLAAMVAQVAMLRLEYSEAMSHALRAKILLGATVSPMRGAVELVLGHVARYANELAQAVKAYESAEKISRDMGNEFLRSVAASFQSVTYRLQGRLSKAFAMSQRGLQLGTLENGQRGPSVSLFYIELAWIALERNDLAAAEHYVLEVINPDHMLSLVDGLHYDRYFILAHVRASQKRWAEAFQLADEALAHPYEPREPNPALMVALAKAKWALLAGDVQLAERFWSEAANLENVYASLPLGVVADLEPLVRVRLQQAHHQLDDASRGLEQLIPKLEQAGRIPGLIEALLLRTLVLGQQGKAAEASATLEQALLLAEPEGYVRPFLDEGEAIKTLLHQAKVRENAPAFVSNLLGKISTDTQSAPLLRPISPPALEPLTTRELTILRLISAGQSDKEIAKELSLAVNTVKWYARTIYGKLGVSKRAKAVAKALELNLL